MIGWRPRCLDRRIASVRYRCLHPLAELERRGLPVELFSPRRMDRYSTVVFSKAYDEESLALARTLRRRGTRVIFDICDNHFYNPYQLESLEVARRQLLDMLSLADRVVASTETLAGVLREEGRLEEEPVVIGDAVEDLSGAAAERGGGLRRLLRSAVRRLPPRGEAEGRMRVLWFGVHGGDHAPFGMLDILKVKDLLVEADRRHPLVLVVVSNSLEKFRRHIRPLPLRTRYIEWRESRLGEALRSADLNIIPIERNPFTLCKSNNRLALALFSGLPTVADGIPSYRDLAPFCVLDDWERGLLRYPDDPAVRREHLERARRHIAERYTIRQIGDQWARLLAPAM